MSAGHANVSQGNTFGIKLDKINKEIPFVASKERCFLEINLYTNSCVSLYLCRFRVELVFIKIPKLSHSIRSQEKKNLKLIFESKVSKSWSHLLMIFPSHTRLTELRYTLYLLLLRIKNNIISKIILK